MHARKQSVSQSVLSVTHSLTHPLTHSLTHSSTHVLTHARTQSITHPFIPPPTHPTIISTTHSPLQHITPNHTVTSLSTRQRAGHPGRRQPPPGGASGGRLLPLPPRSTRHRQLPRPPHHRRDLQPARPVPVPLLLHGPEPRPPLLSTAIPATLGRTTQAPAETKLPNRMPGSGGSAGRALVDRVRPEHPPAARRSDPLLHPVPIHQQG